MSNLTLQALHHAATAGVEQGEKTILLSPLDVAELINAYWAAEKRACQAEARLESQLQARPLFPSPSHFAN